MSSAVSQPKPALTEEKPKSVCGRFKGMKGRLRRTIASIRGDQNARSVIHSSSIKDLISEFKSVHKTGDVKQ